MAMAPSSTAKLRLERGPQDDTSYTGASPHFMIRYTGPIPDRARASRHASREQRAQTPRTILKRPWLAAPFLPEWERFGIDRDGCHTLHPLAPRLLRCLP